MESDAKPTVSVCMITYEHEPYIAQAIDGVLMQETDFSVELVIGEDGSSDRTGAICREYASKYPDRIRLIERERNLGMSENFADTISHCTGKYIAFCEGDDYWSSEYKLSEQIEFLEKNRTYSGACTTVRILEDSTGKFDDVHAHRKLGLSEDITVERYLVDGLTINTCTFICRRSLIDTSIFEGNMLAMDFAVFLLAMDKGPIYFRNTPEAVYRINEGSVTFTRNWGKFAKMISEFLDVYDHYTDGRHAAAVAVKRRYVELIQRLAGNEWNVFEKAAFIARYAVTNRLPPDEVKSLIGTAFPQSMNNAIRAKRRLLPNSH